MPKGTALWSAEIVMKEKELREEGLDKTLADSFPSSDPPSTIPDPVLSERQTDFESVAGSENTSERSFRGSTNSIESALKSAAQKVLDSFNLKIDIQQLTVRITDQPLAAFNLSAMAGFIIGGGIATRFGWSVLRNICSQAAWGAATGWAMAKTSSVSNTK